MTEQMKQVLEKDKNQLYADDYCYIDLSDYDIDISDRSNRWIGDRLEDAAKHFFDKGADSYRNNVWHQASEEPKDKAQCLVISKRKSKEVVTYSNQFFYKGHVIADSCKLYKLTDIVMWADMEDLLPNTKGGEL
jgi:hypothetical protein